jgi:hypothetical protein
MRSWRIKLLIRNLNIYINHKKKKIKEIISKMINQTDL